MLENVSKLEADLEKVHQFTNIIELANYFANIIITDMNDIR